MVSERWFCQDGEAEQTTGPLEQDAERSHPQPQAGCREQANWKWNKALSSQNTPPVVYSTFSSKDLPPPKTLSPTEDEVFNYLSLCLMQTTTDGPSWNQILWIHGNVI